MTLLKAEISQIEHSPPVMAAWSDRGVSAHQVSAATLADKYLQPWHHLNLNLNACSEIFPGVPQPQVDRSFL